MANEKNLRVGDRLRVTRYNGCTSSPFIGVATVTEALEYGAYIRYDDAQKGAINGLGYVAYGVDDAYEVIDRAPDPEAAPAVDAPEQMNAAGNRANGGKTKWTLMLRRMWPALREVVRVAEMGAKKYSVDGWWNNELDEDETADAAIRHILAVISDVYIDAKGDVCYGQNDPESELPHWAHAAWNVLAIGALRIKRGMPRSGGAS